MISFLTRLRLSWFWSGATGKASARTTVNSRLSCLSFAFTMFAVCIAVGLLWEQDSPRLRDPEYAARAACIQRQTQAHPTRPLVLALGSSRVAIGVCPTAYEETAAPNSPLLLNGALTGAGPIMQLLALRRFLAEGFQPMIVLLEYWPPFLRGDGDYREELRFDLDRLTLRDEPVISAYYSQPDVVLHGLRQRRWQPISAQRRSVLARWFPNWIPNSQQTQNTWNGLDSWGWLPNNGLVQTADAPALRASVGQFYQPLHANYKVSPLADCALRETISLCRERGTRVYLVHLPDASWFEEFRTPHSRELAKKYLTKLLTDTGVSLIDGRAWATDADLPDGFHLTIPGAREFTQKLMAALAIREAKSQEGRSVFSGNYLP